MVFILIAGWEIVIAGLAVIIAGLAITISCHEPNFTVGSGGMGMVADEMAVDSALTTAGMGMAAAGSGILSAGSGILVADSGILPAGAILVGGMGDGMGMWGGVGGNREGGDSANNCSGGVQLFVNKHIT